MNVDWYCLISSTKSVEPTEKDGELYLTEGNSVMGTWGEFSTETALKTLDGKSGISLSNPSIALETAQMSALWPFSNTQ